MFCFEGSNAGMTSRAILLAFLSTSFVDFKSLKVVSRCPINGSLKEKVGTKLTLSSMKTNQSLIVLHVNAEITTHC